VGAKARRAEGGVGPGDDEEDRWGQRQRHLDDMRISEKERLSVRTYARGVS
jgi:hypothetical protein